jgi:hypothetical protein
VESKKKDQHSSSALSLFVVLSFFLFCTRSNKISRSFSITSPLLFTLTNISPLFTDSSEKHSGVGGLLSRFPEDRGTINTAAKGCRTAHASGPRHFRNCLLCSLPASTWYVISSLLRLGAFATEKPYIQSLHLMAYTRDVYRVRASGFVPANSDEKKLASANPATPGRQTHATQFS